MEFFRNFPYIWYEFTHDGDSLALTEILRRFKFRGSLIFKSEYWEDFIIPEHETLESLAYKLYGDTKLHWVILMYNNMIDPFEDFPMDTQTFEDYLNIWYPKPPDDGKKYFYLKTIVESFDSNGQRTYQEKPIAEPQNRLTYATVGEEYEKRKLQQDNTTFYSDVWNYYVNPPKDKSRRPKNAGEYVQYIKDYVAEKELNQETQTWEIRTNGDGWKYIPHQLKVLEDGDPADFFKSEIFRLGDLVGRIKEKIQTENEINKKLAERGETPYEEKDWRLEEIPEEVETRIGTVSFWDYFYLADKCAGLKTIGELVERVKTFWGNYWEECPYLILTPNNNAWVKISPKNYITVGEYYDSLFDNELNGDILLGDNMWDYIYVGKPRRSEENQPKTFLEFIDYLKNEGVEYLYAPVSERSNQTKFDTWEELPFTMYRLGAIQNIHGKKGIYDLIFTSSPENENLTALHHYQDDVNDIVPRLVPKLEYAVDPEWQYNTEDYYNYRLEQARVTNREWEYRLNRWRRKIRIPKKEYIRQIEEELRSILLEER